MNALSSIKDFQYSFDFWTLKEISQQLGLIENLSIITLSIILIFLVNYEREEKKQIITSNIYEILQSGTSEKISPKASDNSVKKLIDNGILVRSNKTIGKGLQNRSYLLAINDSVLIKTRNILNQDDLIGKTMKIMKDFINEKFTVWAREGENKL